MWDRVFCEAPCRLPRHSCHMLSYWEERLGARCCLPSYIPSIASVRHDFLFDLLIRHCSSLLSGTSDFRLSIPKQLPDSLLAHLWFTSTRCIPQLLFSLFFPSCLALLFPKVHLLQQTHGRYLTLPRTSWETIRVSPAVHGHLELSSTAPSALPYRKTSPTPPMKMPQLLWLVPHSGFPREPVPRVILPLTYLAETLAPAPVGNSRTPPVWMRVWPVASSST